MQLSDLKPAPSNPRRITPEALAALKVSLSELGDISGLVFNKQSQHLVAGHQRLRALQELYGDNLKMEDTAIVTPTGERFPVRVVDWDGPKEKAANIAANSELLQGEFTDGLGALLDELKIELPDLSEGLRLPELKLIEVIPPEDFKEYGEDLETEHVCPKCGYRWS